MLIIHKFGGTSVGDAHRISSVVDIILEHRQRTDDAQDIIVVSAMSGVTDQLIRGARAATRGDDPVYREIKANLLARHLEVIETLLPRSSARLEIGGFIEDQLNELERIYRSIAILGELTVRGRDVVVSFGEKLSANMLAAILRERNVWSEAVIATELIVTDDRFGEAAPMIEPTRERLQQRLLPLLGREIIPVVTGYIAATEDGIPTTLGRGGSDYTAALLGAGLDADEVWIWSDVDGILTADPNLVPEASTLAELSYSEASNLAYYGAEVLHPKTIRPVTDNNIPLRILNSFNPTNTGTLIVADPSPDRQVYPAIISTPGLSLVVVGSKDDCWSLPLAARALQTLSKAGLPVLMFSQSFSEHSLNLVVGKQDQRHCLRVLKQEFLDNDCSSIYQFSVNEWVGTVSVVGLAGDHGNGIVARAYGALAKCGTQVISVAQPASEGSISFCIPEDQIPETVVFIYRELGLDQMDVKSHAR